MRFQISSQPTYALQLNRFSNFKGDSAYFYRFVLRDVISYSELVLFQWYYV